MKEPVIRTVYRNNIYYNQNHIRHRENGPTFIGVTGYMTYRRYSELHREDGPAIIQPDGTREYFKNGWFVKMVEP